MVSFFFFKQKTAYEIRISDWSSDVCSSDLLHAEMIGEDLHDLIAFVMAQQTMIDEHAGQLRADRLVQQRRDHRRIDTAGKPEQHVAVADRSEERRVGQEWVNTCRSQWSL